MLLDVRSMRGADINTTHYLVRGYVSIKLKCPQKRKKRVRQPALENLRDKSKSQEYSNKIAEKYYTNDQELGNSPLEEQWKKLRDIITDISFEVLGERGRKKRTEHLSKDTKNLLKERPVRLKRNLVLLRIVLSTRRLTVLLGRTVKEMIMPGLLE